MPPHLKQIMTAEDMAKNWRWIPKDVDLWLSSMTIATMTFSQQGIFEALLCRAWNEDVCGVTKDLETLAQILPGRKEATFMQDLAFVVSKCFVQHDENTGLITNKTQLAIWREQRNKYERLAKAGRKGGRAKLKQGLSDACVLLEAIAKDPSVSVSYINKKERGRIGDVVGCYFTQPEFAKLPHVISEVAKRNAFPCPTVFELLRDFTGRKAESRYAGRKQSDYVLICNWGAQAYFDHLARARKNAPRDVAAQQVRTGPAHQSHQPFVADKPKTAAEMEADKRFAREQVAALKLVAKGVA